MNANVKFFAINFDWTQNFCGSNIPIPPLPYKEGGELCAFENITFEDSKELNRFAYCKNAFFLEKALKEMIDRYLWQHEIQKQLKARMKEFGILPSLKYPWDNKKNTKTEDTEKGKILHGTF